MYWTRWDRPALLEHAALVAGLKHYLPDASKRMRQGLLCRLRRFARTAAITVDNFYYEQEDRLVEAARQYGFNWSVHRPAYDYRLRARQRW